MSSDIQTVPARRGAATIVKQGQKIKIINTHGNQVVDTWAIALPSSTLHTTSSKAEAPLYPNATSDSPSKYSSAANAAASAPEYMSMCHCRASLLKVTPAVGDVMVSQKRAPMVKVVEDTSPGVHDTLIAACDRWRYSELGVTGYHESCTDNFWDALHALSSSSSLSAEEKESLEGLREKLGGKVPDPFNLFMNIPITQEGSGAKRGVSFEAPLTKPGDYVVLQAQRDVVVAMSACPQDVLTINGKNPVDAHFQVSD
ncbi:Nn.00g021610.m01.CDS01 [Neocucurbitaria sp. VM-36]